MIISRISKQRRVYRVLTATILTAAMAVGGSEQSFATGTPHKAETVDTTKQWSLNGVHHIIGLPGVHEKAAGKLSMASKGIEFESNGGTVFVDSKRILNVSVGGERFLKGGTFGRIVRGTMPSASGLGAALAHANQYSFIGAGVGLAASALSQGHMDIITIEFVDPKDGYHGAVFTMPWHGAAGLEDNVLPASVPATTAPHQANCQAASVTPAAISVLPVVSEGADVPDEYRVLIYERLLNRIREAQPQLQIYRSGDPNAAVGCDTWEVAMTVNAFSKGDAVKRALVGPAGLFVGTTNLNCRLVVRNSHGDSMLDEQMRAAVRGDNESLDLSVKVAKAINRKIVTALKS